MNMYISPGYTLAVFFVSKSGLRTKPKSTFGMNTKGRLWFRKILREVRDDGGKITCHPELLPSFTFTDYTEKQETVE
jgi:hypothetical protein